MLPEDTTSNPPIPEGMLEEDRAAIEEAAREQRRKDDDFMVALALDIEKKFESRQASRSQKESEWLTCMSLYLGSLGVKAFKTSPDKPFYSTAGSDRPDFNIVRSKCDIAVAQCIMSQFAAGDKNWNIKASPYPDIEPSEAASKAEAMECHIADQLEASKYGFKVRQAIEDRVVLGTGIIKGPVNAMTKKKIYKPAPTPDGRSIWVPEFVEEVKPDLHRINPWFFFPDDSVNDIGMAADAIEVHPMSKKDLVKLAKSGTGFREEAIKKLLELPPKEYINNSFTQFAAMTDSNPYIFRNKYTVIEYHGPIDEDALRIVGIDPAIDPIGGCYFGEVWVCQGEILRIELETIEGSYSVPYLVCPWKKDPASIFGFGAPLLMRDQQRVVTETWHMILDNASISSGPQVIMDQDSITPADGDREFNPRKVWYHNSLDGKNVTEAVYFFVPPNVSDQLMPVLEMARAFAEEESMTPMINAGLQSAETQSDSATGLAILKQASTTVLDLLSEEWDDKVTEPLIRDLYAWNMQFGPDELKGDFEVDVRTSTEYRSQEMRLRDLEKLSLEASQNPAIGEWINMDELSQARLSAMHIPFKYIVKPKEQVAQEREAAAQNPPPDPEMMKVQLEERKLALEEAKLQYEITQAMERERMEHEERKLQQYARMAESESSVIKSQNEKEIELLRLMQRDKESAMKIMSQEKIQLQTDATQRFLAGMEANRKAREQLLKEEEMEYAKREGKGI